MRHVCRSSIHTTPQNCMRLGQSSLNLAPQPKRGEISRSNTMPFVRIDLLRGKAEQYRKTLGQIVYQAMIDVINVPKDDKFQVITEHAAEDLNVAASYLGNDYSKDIIFIQVTLSSGRSVELKKAFYKRIVDDIGTRLKGRPQDVFINLVEVAKENWSFGGGIAHYAT